MQNYYRHINLPFEVDLLEFAKFDCNLKTLNYSKKPHDLPKILVDFFG